MFHKTVIAALTIFLIFAGSLAFAESCPDLGIGQTWTFSWQAVRYDTGQFFAQGYYTSKWGGDVNFIGQSEDKCMAWGTFIVKSIEATSEPPDPYSISTNVPLPFEIPFTMIMTPGAESIGINLNVDISHYIGTLNYDHDKKAFSQMEYNIYGENLTGKGTSTRK